MDSFFPMFLLFDIMFIIPVGTHWHKAYAHWEGDVTTWNPDWMAKLADDYPIRAMNIPGTHDSCIL